MMASIEEQRLKKWIQVLHDNDTEMSRIAAEKLASIGDKRAVPELVKALEGRTMFVAAAAAKALGILGDKSAINSLVHTMSNTRNDVVVRTACAEALGLIGHYTAIEGLQGVIEDYINKNKHDRFNHIHGYERGLFTTAIRSLKQIGTPKAKRIAFDAEKF